MKVPGGSVQSIWVQNRGLELLGIARAINQPTVKLSMTTSITATSAAKQQNVVASMGRVFSNGVGAGKTKRKR